MGRPIRTDHHGGWYHVFNRGAAKQSIFSDDADRVEFGRLLGVAHERTGMVVHAYCLMSNHFHLLLEFPKGGLSDAMHLIGSSYVRHHNQRVGRDGPLFRDRFQAKPVVDEAYRLRLMRYIHRNPLAFLTLAELRRYRWSSLRTLLGDRRAPFWMQIDRTLEVVGGADELWTLVMSDDDAESSRLASSAGWSAAIATAVAVSDSASSLAFADRTVALLVADRLGAATPTELATMFDFPTAQARRSAMSRARSRLGRFPDLASAVDDALDLAG